MIRVATAFEILKSLQALSMTNTSTDFDKHP
jgi:hypothetical protein